MSAATLKKQQTGNSINFITLDTLIGLPCRLDDVEYNKLLFYFTIISTLIGLDFSILCVWKMSCYQSVCLPIISLHHSSGNSHGAHIIDSYK